MNALMFNGRDFSSYYNRKLSEGVPVEKMHQLPIELKHLLGVRISPQHWKKNMQTRAYYRQIALIQKERNRHLLSLTPEELLKELKLIS